MASPKLGKRSVADRIALRLQITAEVLRHGTVGRTEHQGDMDAAFWPLYRQVVRYTMTPPERLFALRTAIHYVEREGVPGDVVECGVWRGGSTMMAALAMNEVGGARRLWLYDTFEGMTRPGELDRDAAGVHVGEEYESWARSGGWAVASLDEVRANLARTNYDPQLINFVLGPVEQTIPATMPSEIALLRLDTDWYESTRHELEHLWPLLRVGGVLIIDDYGHFQGARQAVDEFFGRQPHRPLLHRVDYSARVAVKSG